MAKSISSIKKTATGPGKLIKRIAAVSFSLLIIVFTFIYLNNVDQAARDTVSVVRVKSAGLPAYTIISKDNVEKYDIIKREFDRSSNGMILYADVENIYDLLTAYYIRGGTFLYKDQLIIERPQRNEWLYELPHELEVLTLPYNYMEAGGDILLPGDQIRIRVIYEVTDTSDNDMFDTNPNQFFMQGKKTMKTEILFDSIVVTDMINSNARSIYEIYNEVMRLSEENRQDVMKSSKFMSSIRPRALLLAATPEQVDTYARYRTRSGSGSGNFLITLLSRSNSDVILDQLPTLESEVNLWLREGQKN